MSDLLGVTDETLAAIRTDVAKAQSAGYTTSLGLTGYALEAPAKSLFPVLSPLRNRVRRTKAAIGSQAAHWKAITGINVTNANPFVPFGYAGSAVTTQEQDFLAAYVPIALGDTVQLDAQVLARGFDDLRARSGTNLLYALMIAEDKMLTGGQNFSLGTATATAVQADTGGTIAASTAVHAKVRVRTIENFHFGGGTALSADATVTTSTVAAATHSVTFTAGVLRGGVAYDWYVGADTTHYFYAGTTTVPVLTVTALPGADFAGSLPAGCAAAAAGGGTNVVLTDTSADANAFNGLMASLAGDYGTNGLVTHGGGTSSGAVFSDLGGATLTGSQGGVAEIDNVLQSLWDVSRVSPTVMFSSSHQLRDITRKVVASGGAYTLYQPDNIAERQGIVGGQLLKTYLNPAVNAQAIEMVVSPHVPDGTIIMASEVLPYPGNNVESVLAVETQQEYEQIEYPPARVVGAANGGPRYDLEVRAIETFKNQFPAGCAVLSGIANG